MLASGRGDTTRGLATGPETGVGALHPEQALDDAPTGKLLALTPEEVGREELPVEVGVPEEVDEAGTEESVVDVGAGGTAELFEVLVGTGLNDEPSVEVLVGVDENTGLLVESRGVGVTVVLTTGVTDETGVVVGVTERLEGVPLG